MTRYHILVRIFAPLSFFTIIFTQDARSQTVPAPAPPPSPAPAAAASPEKANGQGSSNKNNNAGSSGDEEKDISRDKCLMQRPALGDLEFLPGGDNWSTGLTVSTQALKYTFGTKQTSLNTTAGVGIAFRYYGKSVIGDEHEAGKLGFDLKKDRLDFDKNSKMYSLPVYRVTPACRATTSDMGKERKKKLASAIFSITPTLYASKQTDEANIAVQPALLVGFFDDIISIGPGFNLSGPQTGKVFLVFSVGYGFKF